ncbi:unnamed protein product [Nesidiocoris tenuis]|uniref:Uncharacterized protein n=1 Tax=Nesidiocoris tenuis TaxID=355587 RepID=A0A6H5HZ19_9HEMI|nr:unnamed protein product [Nesidiocoris tenuis]
MRCCSFRRPVSLNLRIDASIEKFSNALIDEVTYSKVILKIGSTELRIFRLLCRWSKNFHFCKLAHVVSAFEQSLSNMTQRLQQLTSTAEKKDSELMELRQTIELLRKQSVEAGLTSQGLSSPQMSRRHTINSSDPGNDNGKGFASEGNISRQLSTDSVSSLNSLSSACSLSSTPHNQETEKKKKRGWLRSSFNKAFSRGKKTRNGSASSDADERLDLSAPSSPLLNHPHMMMNGGGSNGNDSLASHSPTE